MFNQEAIDREEHYNYHANQFYSADQNSDLIDGIVIHHGESHFVDKK